MVRLGVRTHWDEALCFALNNRPIFGLMVDNGIEFKKYSHIALQGAIAEGKKKAELSSSSLKVLTPTSAHPYRRKVFSKAEKRINYSSIYYAILHGHLDVCKFLIEHGVQPEGDDFELAREKGYDEIGCILSGLFYLDVPEKEELIKRWIITHS